MALPGPPGACDLRDLRGRFARRGPPGPRLKSGSIPRQIPPGCARRSDGTASMGEAAKHIEKAERLLQKGKQGDALVEFLCAIELEPRNLATRRKAADLCIALEKNKEAASLLEHIFDEEAAVPDVARAMVTYKRLAKLKAPS